MNKNKYNYKCDVWGVGLILYELATGKDIPYKVSDNPTIFVLAEKIIKGNPPNLDGESERSEDLKSFIKAWYDFCHIS